jgi:hypothetical protein
MRFSRVVAAVGAAAAGLAFAVPAPASASVTGAVAFTCEAHLSTFPAASGTGTCTNPGLPANALGAAAGTDDVGTPYALVGPGVFSASFTYHEACAPTDVVPNSGGADGTATLSNVPAIDGVGLPTTATLTTGFSWNRVGIIAIIQTHATVIVFANGHRAGGTVDDNAVAVFLPEPGFGTCSSPGPTNALVAGADVETS